MNIAIRSLLLALSMTSQLAFAHVCDEVDSETGLRKNSSWECVFYNHVFEKTEPPNKLGKLTPRISGAYRAELQADIIRIPADLEKIHDKKWNEFRETGRLNGNLNSWIDKQEFLLTLSDPNFKCDRLDNEERQICMGIQKSIRKEPCSAEAKSAPQLRGEKALSLKSKPKKSSSMSRLSKSDKTETEAAICECLSGSPRDISGLKVGLIASAFLNGCSVVKTLLPPSRERLNEIRAAKENSHSTLSNQSFQELEDCISSSSSQPIKKDTEHQISSIVSQFKIKFEDLPEGQKLVGLFQVQLSANGNFKQIKCDSLQRNQKQVLCFKNKNKPSVLREEDFIVARKLEN